MFHNIPYANLIWPTAGITGAVELACFLYTGADRDRRAARLGTRLPSLSLYPLTCSSSMRRICMARWIGSPSSRRASTMPPTQISERGSNEPRATSPVRKSPTTLPPQPGRPCAKQIMNGPATFSDSSCSPRASCISVLPYDSALLGRLTTDATCWLDNQSANQPPRLCRAAAYYFCEPYMSSSPASPVRM
jgi:hypothetical protein